MSSKNNFHRKGLLQSSSKQKSNDSNSENDKNNEQNIEQQPLINRILSLELMEEEDYDNKNEKAKIDGFL
jgi:hypothetical protein